MSTLAPQQQMIEDMSQWDALPDAKRTTRHGVEYVLLNSDELIDAYAAKHGNRVIGMDFNGDSKTIRPQSRAYRPWVARADGKSMDDNEVEATDYQLVRDLTNQ